VNAPAERLKDAAERVARLCPDWSDPERYFSNRQEIERELQRIARQLEREHG
jgi:hypothetical protein